MNTERRRVKHSVRKGAQTSSGYYGVSFRMVAPRTGKKSKMDEAVKYPWLASISLNGKTVTKRFPTEREAAIQVDKWVLQYRLNAPLNILKPKA